MRILHLSPHPDDETIAAAGTLFALRDAGNTITTVAWTLGAPDSAKRRKSEMEEACKRANFNLLIPDLEYLSSSENQTKRIQDFVVYLDDIVADYDLLVAPSPHDGHPAHEAVGRAAVSIAAKHNKKLWLWGLWADLSLPTLVTVFDEEIMNEILYCVSAYKGEIERNDYLTMIPARAKMNAIMGAEKVFGWGAKGFQAVDYVELLTEIVYNPEKESFHLGDPRILNPNFPFAESVFSIENQQEGLLPDFSVLRGRNKTQQLNLSPDVTDWLYSDSPQALLAQRSR